MALPHGSNLGVLVGRVPADVIDAMGEGVQKWPLLSIGGKQYFCLTLWRVLAKTLLGLRCQLSISGQHRKRQATDKKSASAGPVVSLRHSRHVSPFFCPSRRD